MPSSGAAIQLRRAVSSDVPQFWEIFHQHEVEGAAAPPPRRDTPALYRHELETGEVWVAERAGLVIAYAATIDRGGTVFLAELFVRPGHRSSGIGQQVLRRVVPDDGRPFFISSSDDPRAVALYVRAGTLPLWPLYALIADDARAEVSDGEVAVVDAAPGDPELLRWDSEIGGRSRQVDHDYWSRATEATPLWFTRAGRRIGYGFVQRRCDEHVWHADAWSLGPLGVRDERDAVACTEAAVAWARARNRKLRIFVSAPHPALRPLLASGFRIDFADTFMSSTGAAFADPRRYLPFSFTLF